MTTVPLSHTIRWNASHMLALLMALALACVIAAHHIDFITVNAGELALGSRLVRSAILAWLGVLTVGVVLRALLWRLPLWMVWAALVPVTYLGYAYHEINALLGLLEPSMPKSPQEQLVGMHVNAATIEYASHRLLIWGLLFFSLLSVLLSLLRHTRGAWITLIGAATALLITIGNWVSHKKPSTATETTGHVVAFAAKGLNLIERPNIYWLVADGYPALDLLQRDFHLDTQAFSQWLDAQGFLINHQTWANYPSTINSISNTVSGTYLIDAHTSPDHVRDLAWMRERVRGNNPLVNLLRANGYRYIHFSSGYEVLTLCVGHEDRCLVGIQALDEIDVALLRRTPALDVAILWQHYFPSENPPYAQGSFDAVLDKLPAAFEVPAPYFMYAHVVAPHPPMRLTRECVHRPQSFDLREWNPAQRAAFAEQVECVNTQLRRVITRIVQEDPTAVIVLQSDHGSAFRGQFNRKNDLQWDTAEIEERFRVLNAIRAPQRCHSSLATQRTLINTYPLLLACLAQQAPQLQPDRLFLAPYDNSPNFGRVVEIPLPETS